MFHSAAVVHAKWGRLAHVVDQDVDALVLLLDLINDALQVLLLRDIALQTEWTVSDQSALIGSPVYSAWTT